jgi:predicted nucleic acid-binding protein
LISYDTGIIVSCAQSLEYLKKIVSHWNPDNQRHVISSKVQGESINLLSGYPFYWSKSEAIEKVREVIRRLNLRRDFIKDEDRESGKLLIQKYPELNYPDNIIIAHFKRLRVSIALTCDRTFKTVCDSEGIKGIYLPKFQ